MTNAPSGPVLLIEGFDSLTEIYRREIPAGAITTAKLKELLRSLVARQGLTCDEIVAAHQKRRTKGERTSLLEVRVTPAPTVYSCGENPYFTARVIFK
jgi:hypothetical protein